MRNVDVAKLLSRRAWLKRAERDLASRVERQISLLESAVRAHLSDPLYQRLWSAHSGVRRELQQVDETLAPLFESAA